MVGARRALDAVLQVLTVAFVTLAARVQHSALRAKHWAVPVTAAVAAYALLGLNGYLWLAGPDKYIW